MRIAISASGQAPDALLDPRFGRCAFYAVYDRDEDSWDFLPNPGVREGSGAGIKAAQFLLEQNVDVLLTGNLGPNASRLLGASKIEVFALPEVTLKEALKLHEEGQGKLISEATVGAHTGLRTPPDTRRAEPVLPQVRIAVATEGTEVAQHFGRCSAYTLVDIEDGMAVEKTVIANPGHQPGFLPRFLAEKGVKCIIAGGMGPRAQNLFIEQGISTVIGVVGPVTEAIDAYLSGNLVGGVSLCNHDQDGGDHDCGEH